MAKPAAPSVEETEFWRSADRIGTMDAYRAYLKQFPDGFFSALARAALDKFEGAAERDIPRSNQAKPERSLPRAVNQEPLNTFTEPAANSDAITFKLGDRFNGPGLITIGWIGGKKQLILPSGEWIALSAVDRDSSHAAPVKLTTVIFGKFLNRRLVTAFFGTTSRVSSIVTSWADVDECEKPDPLRLREWKTPTFSLRRECSLIKPSAVPIPTSGKMASEVQRSLAALGATVTSGPALLTTFNFTDRSNGFMRVARIDWPSAVLGEEAGDRDSWKPDLVRQSRARSDYLVALASWAESYRKFALRGFSRDIAEDDLIPAAPAPKYSAVQGVGEFMSLPDEAPR